MKDIKDYLISYIEVITDGKFIGVSPMIKAKEGREKGYLGEGNNPKIFKTNQEAREWVLEEEGFVDREEESVHLIISKDYETYKVETMKSTESKAKEDVLALSLKSSNEFRIEKVTSGLLKHYRETGILTPVFIGIVLNNKCEVQDVFSLDKDADYSHLDEGDSWRTEVGAIELFYVKNINKD